MNVERLEKIGAEMEDFVWVFRLRKVHCWRGEGEVVDGLPEFDDHWSVRLAPEVRAEDHGWLL
jgi:hypothetical protein